MIDALVLGVGIIGTIIAVAMVAAMWLGSIGE
jgi:hypothetical protein